MSNQNLVALIYYIFYLNDNELIFLPPQNSVFEGISQALKKSCADCPANNQSQFHLWYD
jgi:hypothetical protein